MQFPLITYSMALNLLTTVHRQNFNTEKILCTNIIMRASGASELRKFSHYIYSKPAISFNILLILQILCRFTGTDKSLNVPTKLRKSNRGGGPSHYASVVFCRKSMTFVLIQFLVHYSLSWPIMTLSTPCKLPEKRRENICVRASRASELGKLSHFHIQKLIFKVLVICRYTVSNFDILLYIL